jgi:hypothetical protein
MNERLLASLERLCSVELITQLIYQTARENLFRLRDLMSDFSTNSCLKSRDGSVGMETRLLAGRSEF